MFGKTPLSHLSGLLFTSSLLAGCASTIPEPHTPSTGHIAVEEDVVETTQDIPAIVDQPAYLPPPLPQPEPQDLERYTVVVNDVPVKELLFALARDASLNIDVSSDISGLVTLNAVEQTLPQILERISRQAKLRYELKDNNLYIETDTPYFRTYKIDYVNISRDTEGEISVATQVATTGTIDVSSTGSSSNNSTGNNSTTNVRTSSKHRFWETLTANIRGILQDNTNNATDSKNVIVNAESGVLTVMATRAKHLEVQEFIDRVMQNIQRQVLIEATIVEVTLNDRFQSGVDWKAVFGGKNFLTLEQSLSPALNALDDSTAFFSGIIQSDNTDNPDFRSTIRLLKTFGDAKVLSSPKLMTLNNQTAVLKVVDNLVYFTIDSQISQGQLGTGNLASIESQVHTVPVGLVMSVTPQINENMEVTMNVRPTISRIIDQVVDPGPQLIAATLANQLTNVTVPDINSQIPVIAVREMESILKVTSGQTAVLGGLMQDNYQRDRNSVPGVDEIPVAGEAFKQKDYQNAKSELVIFLRPIVVRNASLNGDLSPYRQYLQNNVTSPLPLPK